MYENMTAYEFLDYQAMLKGLKEPAARHDRIQHVLQSVHMDERQHDKISSFSGGMKQRIGIAQTLLHLPRILVVDEPTAGLDPRERIRFRNLLVELSRERIVIFSTHIIEDISSSCNRVAVLNRGELRYLGEPNTMAKMAEGRVWQFIVPVKDFEGVQNNFMVVHHMRVEDSVRVRCIAAESPADDAITVQPTLEDSYLWLLKKK
jgi:ABC-type multidrug transport system ATPase subunit